MRPAGNRRSRAAVSSLGGGIIRGGMNQKARLVVNVKGSGQARAHELLLRLYAVATDEETAVFDSLACEQESNGTAVAAGTTRSEICTARTADNRALFSDGRRVSSSLGHGSHLRRTQPDPRGLFELTITYADDDEQRERCKALAAKLGGDPDATFFQAE